jgi:hypothetical protein
VPAAALTVRGSASGKNPEASTQKAIRSASGLPQKPRSNFSDGVYPKNLDGVGARNAQAFAKLARTEAVRADHRLRTDDETIRAQSTIFG